jgi:hypothetical protein
LTPDDRSTKSWRAQLDRRSSICLSVIAIGLANFLVYTIAYLIIGGEAITGNLISVDGQTQYILGGRTEPVSRCVFIYSAIHSISIWPTFGAVMLAMLTLAKDRIVESMRSARVRGRAIITLIAVLITIVAIFWTYRFTRQFVRQMKYGPQDTQQVRQVTDDA